MQQIADWLAQLGLGQYAQRFAENEIDVSVLRFLTDQDLKEIGIPLGHRRKILAAIAEASGGSEAAGKPDLETKPKPRGTATALPETTVDGVLPSSQSVEARLGERRYLTVMFCDLVGSTGIAAKLDAEEWRDLVGGYINAASAAVAEMGGHVAKKLGDGILALFGYPVAQENDAERATRAALAIQRALAELNRKNAGSGEPELAARIGLDTGPAVVDAAGDLRRRRQCGGAGAGAGRAGCGTDHGAGAAPDRRAFCRRGARQPHAKGRAGADGALPAHSGERWRPPGGPAPSEALTAAS